jgi:phage FluMu protein Com
MNNGVGEEGGYSFRERLPGQSASDKLYPVRCRNSKCGTKNSQLLGKFRDWTSAEIKCPRCGTTNQFVIKNGVVENEKKR